MFTFRLPDFRWFHLFRDRRQKTSSANVFPQYPAPPNQWHQSQSQSGQHNPVYFSTFLFSLCAMEIDSLFYHLADRKTLLILQ